MKKAIVTTCSVVIALAGCSSDGDILPKKDRFTPSLVDAAISKPRDPEANCVKPGTPPNSRGIGGYCEPGRNDCMSDAGPRFCTADFRDITVIDDDKWFCSTVCMSDDECGEGAVCVTGGVGSGCAPLVCRVDAGM